MMARSASASTPPTAGRWQARTVPLNCMTKDFVEEARRVRENAARERDRLRQATEALARERADRARDRARRAMREVLEDAARESQEIGK